MKDYKKIIHKADITTIIKKLREIIVKERKKYNGKISRVEVPFSTKYLIVETCRKRKKNRREHSIKKVLGVDIIGNAKKLKVITEGKKNGLYNCR